jgi:ribonucleoside-diphosphate reductase alpha subunit
MEGNNRISKTFVTTRSGKQEKVSFDKILERLENLAGDDLNVDPFDIAKETIKGLYSGISTKELDTLSADISANRTHHHPDYNKFASRIAVNNLHKQTHENFFSVVEIQLQAGRISKEYYEFVKTHQNELQAMLDFNRDYKFDYFGFKTLERAYLDKINKNIVERPQHMIMRVAIQIHGLHKEEKEENIQEKLRLIKETYDGMSNLYFTHASPTLFNAGSNHPQLSSCFLLYCGDDLGQIFDTVKDVGMISKWAGGIGIALSDVRARGTLITGTGGPSDGIIPLCKVFNEVGRYVTQGGRRKGSIAIYVEPWHSDIQAFIELRKNTGDENLRARDLFIALWVPDLFMKRVEQGGVWSLMCPKQCPGLTTCYGEEFEKLYVKYEDDKKYTKQIPALKLWNLILESQIETGMPYLLSKEACNAKNNQQNIGMIKSSNLCSEIIQYTDEKEIAVCNLASICLPMFVENKEINYEKLRNVSRTLVRNLDKIIDMNYYPVPETKYSNLRHRPMGIGVQGLSDVYRKLRVPFESEEARRINKLIFENIYFGCLSESIEPVKKYGKNSTFENSPFSQGKPQWALWGLKKEDLSMDWSGIEKDLVLYGTRNSLLTALMPTATTSQIMGNTEAFEQMTSNYYVRQTLAGEYTIINEQLVRDLIERGLWTQQIYEEIIYDNGSIQNITDIPSDLKELYKTAFEIKQSSIIKQAEERAPFIDQTQSMNLFLASPDFRKLASCHFASWKAGLKTWSYYLRTRPVADPTKFGLDISAVQRIKEKRNSSHTSSPSSPSLPSLPSVTEEEAVMVCYRNKDNNGGVCEMCSS